MLSPLERLKGIIPFVVTADNGSFAAAAEQLHLTGSAVSKSVARLEQRLGTRLFERTTRRLKLTDAGQAFYETCIRVLNDLAEAETVLAAQQNTPTGRLRIDLPASFGRLKVMPVLAGFCRRHPQLRPHVTFNDRRVDLVEEGIDVAVRIGGIADLPSSIGSRYLGSEQLIFCAAPDYLAERGEPRNLADLGDHDCIVYGNADGTMKPWSLPTTQPQPKDRARMTPGAYRMMAGDGEAHLTAIEAGLGIGQIATWLARDKLADGRLVRVLDGVEVEGFPLHLLWPKNKQLLPKIDALLQALASELTLS